MSVLRGLEILTSDDGASDHVELTYDQRLVRRKTLTTRKGEAIHVDLARTTSLEAGNAIKLQDGRVVAIIAATEDLYAVSGPQITRYAWHIGNRHTPCQIEADRLVIQRDPVLRSMLEGLGANVSQIEAPFTPEGGAYGHGRTMGHDHGHPATEEHDHDPAHNHSHGHGHPHGHAHD